MDNFIQNFKKRSRSREKDSHNYKIEQRNKSAERNDRKRRKHHRRPSSSSSSSS